MRTSGSLLRALAPLIAVCASAGCDGGSKSPALSHTETIVKTAPVPAENGPQLGAVAELVTVREATDQRAASLGALHAGSRVARSAEPVSSAGCAGGWYAVRPRGFVCTGAEATLDLGHPTLQAMALAPALDASLPYTYARTRSETPLFERDPTRPDGVREIGKLRRRAGMAVVGSWKAKDSGGSEARLALLTNGRFVRAADLEAAKPSDFAGVELTKDVALPLAFVVKRGVRTFRIEGNEADKGDLLEYHARLSLSGRFRSLGSVKYWALEPAKGREPELWVRHQDVTVVQKRATFPDFLEGPLGESARWLDISVVTGTLTAYEGKRAVFTTLVSVARELAPVSGETQNASDGPRPMPLGTFAIKRKDLTYSGKDGLGFGESFEVLDAPWVLELSSGQLIHGAYWHDRFGIEHGAGNLALSPADAARVFRFVQPELPRGWHVAAAAPEQAVQVVLRK
jgi:hypothetical protein